MVYIYILPFHRLLPYLLIISSAVQKLFSFMSSDLLIFAFDAYAFDVISKIVAKTSVELFLLCFILGILWFQVFHLFL